MFNAYIVLLFIEVPRHLNYTAILQYLEKVAAPSISQSLQSFHEYVNVFKSWTEIF